MGKITKGKRYQTKSKTQINNKSVDQKKPTKL
jgi:hypothetical protein